jgi:hypothetical protein
VGEAGKVGKVGVSVSVSVLVEVEVEVLVGMRQRATLSQLLPMSMYGRMY